MYVMIDLTKLTNGTIGLIGQDYNITPDEEGIYWDNIEGYHRYIDKIVNHLLKETEELKK